MPFEWQLAIWVMTLSPVAAVILLWLMWRQ